MKSIKSFFTPLLTEYGGWNVAIRRINGTLLYDGNVMGFHVIKNTTRYWMADPFLFEHEDKAYLFVEMFDRVKWKGVIGYTEIVDGRCGRFTPCLIEKFHLSYPCIFMWNDKTYMVPESYQSEQIRIYEATDFPSKWKLAYTIDGIIASDTTPLFTDGNQLLFTTTLYENKIKQQMKDDNLWILEFKTGQKQKVYDNCLEKRSAGHFIQVGDKLLRPSQDCTQHYGGGLIFNEVLDFTPERYLEQKLMEIIPPNKDGVHRINQIELSERSNVDYYGIHTYNKSSQYEVVDLTYRGKKNLFVFIHNLKLYISQKLKVW